MSLSAWTQETYLPEANAAEVGLMQDFLHAPEGAGSRPASSRYVLADAVSGERVGIPPVVYQVLRQVVDAMSQGLAVTIAPQSQTLTTQQGADLLGVSRPTFVKMLDARQIPFERVGTHRRVLLRDVLAHRQRRREEQYAALEATAISIDSEDDLESTLRDLKQARREVAARRRTPSTARPLSTPVFDAHHDDLARAVADAIQDTVGPAAGGMDAGEVVAKCLTHPVRILDEGGGQEVDDRAGHGLGQRGRDRPLAGGVRTSS